MKALAVVPGMPGSRIVQRPEPSLTSPRQVKLRIVRVGICGTDREEAGGGRALLPSGATDLVIGHEMFGRVVEIGKEVTRVTTGDYAVFTVRRPCGRCTPCTMFRPDMCRTGDYRERGIWGLDGYQTEYVVDDEQWGVRVPNELESIGVLVEPMSVIEKAIAEAVQIQAARLPAAASTPYWLYGRRCLVAGLGPIGLLAALVLRLRGAELWGLDIVEKGTARPEWLERIGGKYVDGRTIQPENLDRVLPPMDLILEATGVPRLSFNLLDALKLNGILALTGIPGGVRPTEIPGAELVRSVVLGNRLMFGSVNAARDHFQMGVDDMAAAHRIWGDHLGRLITSRTPAADAPKMLETHGAEEIKAVVEWPG